MPKKPEAIILLADFARGIYIPQFFAKTVYRDKLRGVSAEDLATLETGPDDEWYWEAWEDVLDNAEIHDGGHVYKLYQDGDLFAYCEALMTAEECREFFGE